MTIDGDPKISNLEYKFIANAVPEVLAMIKDGQGRAFALSEVKTIATLLDYGKIKASSQNKGDMTIVVHDYVTNQDNAIDFSIKSYIGGKPTLLNAGKMSTNFLFEIVGSEINLNEINSIEGGSKVLKRVKPIEDSGAHLSIHSMLSEQFQKTCVKLIV